MQTKFLSLLILVGLMAVCVSPIVAQEGVAPQPAGRIIAARVRGEVYATVKTTDVRIPLAETTEVTQGSSVTTGKSSSVVLVFSNGATLNLGADSVLDIEQFTQDPFGTSFNAAGVAEEPSASTTKLKLTRGELVSKVAKLNKAKGSSFIVGTPVGAAGIRGTTFRIVYRPDSATGKAFFSVTTLEGSVEVTLATGTVTTAPIEVGASQEVEVTADVTTDASGNVTVTLPSGTITLTPTSASTSSTQQVADIAQEIAQAVANMVITPPSLPPPVSPSPTSEPPAPEPPAPIRQPIDSGPVSPSS